MASLLCLGLLSCGFRFREVWGIGDTGMAATSLPGLPQPPPSACWDLGLEGAGGIGVPVHIAKPPLVQARVSSMLSCSPAGDFPWGPTHMLSCPSVTSGVAADLLGPREKDWAFCVSVIPRFYKVRMKTPLQMRQPSVPLEGARSLFLPECLCCRKKNWGGSVSATWCHITSGFAPAGPAQGSGALSPEALLCRGLLGPTRKSLYWTCIASGGLRARMEPRG